MDRGKEGEGSLVVLKPADHMYKMMAECVYVNE